MLFAPLLPSAAFAQGREVVERGQDHRVVQTTEGRRYVEYGSGLHYQDDFGQWQESQEVIDLDPATQGAVAERGPWKAFFSPNLNTAGAIDCVMPDQKRLRGHVLGIYLTDTSSGSSVLVGKVKDSIGELLPPNRIIYRDAFEGGIRADMRYTYGRGFFEAEAILRESPVLPDDFNPETTLLQVVTEFIDPPTPDQSRRGILDFGPMQMIQGSAFTLNEQLSSPFLQASDGRAASVTKQWTQIGSRHVLVESASYPDIAPELAALPQSKTKPSKRMASLGELPELPATGDDTKGEIRLARATETDKGFSIDYVLVSGSGSYTFASGTTYYIHTSGYFGGMVTFRTNCVIKFNTNAYLLIYGAVSCNGTATAPSILTSMDDDLFGEQIEGSTGNPTNFASQALWIYYIQGETTINDMLIRWAKTGVQSDGIAGADLTTVDRLKFRQCQKGIYASGSEVVMTGVTKCGVATPTQAVNDASIVGTMTEDCAGDTDSDGLLDSWELQYFATVNGQNGADDADGDGINNQQEQQSGTSPTTVTALPYPNFANPNVSFELRNIDANYIGDYHYLNPFGIVSETWTSSWGNNVSKGTLDWCFYWTCGGCYDCDHYDWAANTHTHVTDGQTTGFGEAGDHSFLLRPERANVMGYGSGDPDNYYCTWHYDDYLLDSWTFTHSSQYWMTPNNQDGINYVYQLTPTFTRYVSGHPYDCNLTFESATTGLGTVTIGGVAVNVNGNRYLAKQNLVPGDVTPAASGLNWYRYGLTAIKYQAPQPASGPFFAYWGALEPDYDYGFGRIKTGPPGYGYQANLLELIIQKAGTQFMGTPATGANNTVGILSVVSFKVPAITDFNTGWNWNQDVASQIDVFHPLMYTPSRVVTLNRKSWTPTAPSAPGNDSANIAGTADTMPDFSRFIQSADSPGIQLNHPAYQAMRKDTIISQRFRARTWPSWNGSMMTGWYGWHQTLTLKKTSELGVTPVTAKVITSGTSVGSGAGNSTMTLQEAWNYYNQP